jgi:PPE-repeat protein
VSWLTTTAAAAEQAAAQSTASAAAYEAAFSGTVPPPLIAANRATLGTLVATNFLGINTPAIAATEAHYAEMWVQDATAMYTYQAGAMAAAALQPLTPAAPTTNPAGAGAQAAAVAASANPADAFSDIIAGLQAELANIQTALQGATASVSSIGTGLFNSLPTGVQDLLTTLDGFIGTPLIFNGVQQLGVTGAWVMTAAISNGVVGAHTAAGLAAAAAPDAAAAGAEGAAAALASDVAPAGAAAGLGEASLVGGLSVPAGWASAAPATLASSVAPLEGSGWTVPAEAAGGGPMMAGMPGMASAAKGAGAMAGPRYGFKPIVMPKLNVI